MAVKLVIPAMTADFERDLLNARIEARLAARRTAEQELDTSIDDFESVTDEDEARSSAIAKSLAGALALAMLITLKQKQPTALALATQDYRIRRIAATEVPNAYSRQHYDIDVPSTEWARRWDATLDLKVCNVCASMDGETVLLGEPFSKGLVPGDVHPLCRCVPTFVPIAIWKAA